MKNINILRFSLILLFCACSKSDYVSSSDLKGACHYGPTDTEACVKTTKSDCENNFKGKWYAGQDCR